MDLKIDVPSLGTPVADDRRRRSIRWIVFGILAVIALAILVGGAILGR